MYVSQRSITFDDIFGWEYTVIPPAQFWTLVPKLIYPIYHFFNAPVSASEDDVNSVIRVIKQVAKRRDFVSFKLDIDTPQIEIPIALQIAEDEEVASLIDEFFYELHFRCEIMMPCAWSWDSSIPESLHGVALDRHSAMLFFQKMRKRGVRAHFWP